MKRTYRIYLTSNGRLQNTVEAKSHVDALRINSKKNGNEGLWEYVETVETYGRYCANYTVSDLDGNSKGYRLNPVHGWDKDGMPRRYPVSQ